MTIHAYSQLYLADSSRRLGNMLHYAVNEFNIDGGRFLKLFIRSGIAEQFEVGNPKFVSGMSGLELFVEIMEKTTNVTYDVDGIVNYGRTPEYWVGWMLAHYQWYSCHSFKNILRIISYDELIRLYWPFHEADLTKSYDFIDELFMKSESRLKIMRKRRGFTQEELAKASEVSLNTIRAYERKSKDLNKAQVDIVMRLTRVLRCDISDLII